MKFFLTGGSGFIGQHLVSYLVSLGHNVTILDIKAPPEMLDNLPSVEFVQGSVSISNATDLARQSDRIIHLASVVGVKAVTEARRETIETTIKGAMNILQIAKDTGIPTLLMSTSEVYGKNPKLPFQERGDCLLGPTSEPRWGYAAAKMTAEHLALAYYDEFKVPVTICRPFNVVGFGQTTPGMILPTLARQAVAGTPLTVRGDGSQVRSYLDVRDAVRAIASLVGHPQGYGELFNLGNPNNQASVKQIAYSIKAIAQSTSEIVYEKAIPGDNIQARVPDIAKLQNCIGWTPAIDLDTILRSVVFAERSRIAEDPNLGYGRSSEFSVLNQR